MTIRRYVIPVTVNASGDAEVYSPRIDGRLVSFRYVKNNYTGANLAFTITSQTTAQTLWAEEDVNASATRYPRAPTHSTDGSASLYAAGGSPVNNMIAIDNERVKFVVAGAGNATTGTFHFTIDSPK